MPSVTERRSRRGATLLLVALVVSACGQPATSVSSPREVASASGAVSPSTGVEGSGAPGHSIALPQPGLPYAAEDVLEAMRDSRRPGGVPDEIERPAVAEAVAAELWTYDGEPWPELTAGGACGPEVCSLELAGTPPAAVGEDLYVFEVDRASLQVEPVTAELRGLPTDVAEQLDAFARDQWPGDEPPGVLASSRWLPPPDDGRYLLSYRSGGEEGSPAVDALVDLRSGEIELREPG